MLRRIQLLCLAGLLGVPDRAATQPTDKPTVSILVVDEMGDRAPYELQSFRALDTGQDLAAQFVNLQASRIPYGKYRVVLKMSGDACGNTRVEEELDVVALPVYAVWLATDHIPCVAVDGHVPSWYRLKFRVVGDAALPEDARLRLSSLTKDKQIDCILGLDGECDIRQHVRGPYTLTVLSGRKILHQESVYFEGSLEPQPVLIQVSKTRPQWRTVK